MAAPRGDVVVVVFVEVVRAGAGGSGGADWIAYWPRVNGLHTGSCFGSGKSYSRDEPSALSMKSFQIVAGKVPPATAIPCTLVIGISARGEPTHTVVSRFGV